MKAHNAKQIEIGSMRKSDFDQLDLDALAKTYLAIEKDAERQVRRWVEMMQEAGVEPAPMTLREAVEQAAYNAIADEMTVEQERAFGNVLEPKRTFARRPYQAEGKSDG